MTKKKKSTTQQVIPNPTGKGGFGEHPENRNPGGWRKENSISYQYNKFSRMTPQEIEKWFNDWEKPANKKDNINYSAAAFIAARRVRQAMKAEGLMDAKELADRTEGKVPTAIKAEVEAKTDSSQELLIFLKREAEKEAKDED